MMVRKKGKKSRKRLLSLGIPDEVKSKKKGKKRIRKPKMPARIKKNQSPKNKM
jgi:hypothetical protein